MTFFTEATRQKQKLSWATSENYVLILCMNTGVVARTHIQILLMTQKLFPVRNSGTKPYVSMLKILWICLRMFGKILTFKKRFKHVIQNFVILNKETLCVII